MLNVGQNEPETRATTVERSSVSQMWLLFPQLSLQRCSAAGSGAPCLCVPQFSAPVKWARLPSVSCGAGAVVEAVCCGPKCPGNTAWLIWSRRKGALPSDVVPLVVRSRGPRGEPPVRPDCSSRCRDGLPYCEADYHTKFGIRCDGCEKYITGHVLEVSEPPGARWALGPVLLRASRGAPRSCVRVQGYAPLSLCLLVPLSLLGPAR